MKKSYLSLIFISIINFHSINAIDFTITPNTILESTMPISYYDANNKLISSDNGGYTVSPALAVKASVSSGTVKIRPDWTAQAHTCNYDEYMRPFWSADTVYNETVLLLTRDTTTNNAVANGKLLFYPSKILSVKSFDGGTTYQEGIDYTISGTTITKTASSKMVCMTTTSVDNAIQKNQFVKNGRYSGLIFKQAKWITVTYIPDRRDWKMTNFGYKGNLLPKTIAKLNAKQPLKIVAHGMSITRGLNVSGYAEDDVACPPTAPYMRSYIELMNYQLKKQYGYDSISSINASLPGKDSYWLASTAATHVAPLHPDLVIIDMGMNDIWSCKDNYQAFANNVKTAMNAVKLANPDVEFILLGGMMIDKNYALNWDGVNAGTIMKFLYGYQAELKKMETKGVANLDMTTMSDSIYDRKSQYRNYGAKSVTVNEMHPNDFLARCFAQGLVAMLDSTATPNALNSPEINKTSFLAVVPNPVIDGHFIVSISDNVSYNDVLITIHDLSGKQITSFIQQTKSKDYQASDFNLTKGIYVITAKVGQNESSQKVIIQ
jgi:hypothetical protein